MRNLYDSYLSEIHKHRTEVLNYLTDHKLRFGTHVNCLNILGKEFCYHRWLHPYQGTWEIESLFTQEIFNNLKNIIQTDSTVIDIGAQAGYMSVAYSQFAKKVISFEPNPAAYEILAANADLNSNIIPFNLAISSTEGPLEFHYSDPGLCNGGYATDTEFGIGVTGHNIPIDVIAVDLNSFFEYINLKSKISLIKIDAEGHDSSILNSIKPIIDLHKPVVITEIYDGLSRNETEYLLRTIHNLGYKAYDERNNMLNLQNLGPEVRSVDDIKQGSGHNLICIHDT